MSKLCRFSGAPASVREQSASSPPLPRGSSFTLVRSSSTSDGTNARREPRAAAPTSHVRRPHQNQKRAQPGTCQSQVGRACQTRERAAEGGVAASRRARHAWAVCYLHARADQQPRGGVVPDPANGEAHARVDARSRGALQARLQRRLAGHLSRLAQGPPNPAASASDPPRREADAPRRRLEFRASYRSRMKVGFGW